MSGSFLKTIVFENDWKQNKNDPLMIILKQLTTQVTLTVDPLKITEKKNAKNDI